MKICQDKCKGSIAVSIVMPCYNMGAFIRDCFDSLARQTLQSYEVICVDDGSTDDTPEIIREYRAHDSRIKLISQVNLGVFAARNNAMKVAQGEYICFLDPDDWYPSDDTLARMYEAALRNNADICGGGWARHHPDGRIDTKFSGFMEGLNTFAECGFVDYIDYQFDLGYQRFLFRTKLIQDNHIEFPPYKRFQDPPFLVKSMIAAGRFYALNFVTYSYRVGHKAVDWSSDDYRKLKDYMRGLSDNMRVAKAHGLEKLWSNNRDRASGSFFWQTVGNTLSTRSDVFDVYCKMFDDPIDLLKSLAVGYVKYPRALASLLEQSKLVLTPPPRKIRTIGIHYYHLTMGGVQRVIALQVIHFLKMGYRVVLFVEDMNASRHFELPKEVEVVSYPCSCGKDAVRPNDRIERIVQILQEHPVDVFYSHAHMSPFMLWDSLTIRMVCRVPFILHYHSMFTAPFYASNEVVYNRFFEAIPQHRLCDMVVTLSRVDLAYERLNGVHAVYLPNPADPMLAHISLREIPSRPLIIWVGRIDELKCPLDALRIFAKVREKFPSARFRMIGNGAEWLMKRIRQLAEELNLGESFELPGGKSDVYPDYLEASLCLSTSRIEGFPMVSFEALAHGLPIVAYRLPHVELYRDNVAVVQVPQRDIESAAEAIGQMLKDPSRLEQLRKSAVDSVQAYLNYDFVKVWKAILGALENKGPMPLQEVSDEDQKIMMETCYTGIMQLQSRIGSLRLQLTDRDKILQNNKAKLDSADEAIKVLGQELKKVQGKRQEQCVELEDKCKQARKALSDITIFKNGALTKETQLQKQLKSSREEIKRLKGSEAYRAGMFVTWPARRIYRMMKCYRENGFKYTLRRLLLGKKRSR